MSTSKEESMNKGVSKSERDDLKETKKEIESKVEEHKTLSRSPSHSSGEEESGESEDSVNESSEEDDGEKSEDGSVGKKRKNSTSSTSTTTNSTSLSLVPVPESGDTMETAYSAEETLQLSKDYTDSMVASMERKTQVLSEEVKLLEKKFSVLENNQILTNKSKFEKLVKGCHIVLQLLKSFFNYGLDMQNNIIPFVPTQFEHEGVTKDYVAVSRSAFEHVVDQWSIKTKNMYGNMKLQVHNVLTELGDLVPFSFGQYMENKLPWLPLNKTEITTSSNSRDDTELSSLEKKNPKKQTPQFYFGTLSFLSLELLVELFEYLEEIENEYPDGFFDLKDKNIYQNNRGDTRKQIGLRYLQDQAKFGLKVLQPGAWTMIADWQTPQEALEDQNICWKFLIDSKYKQVFPHAYDYLKDWNFNSQMITFHWQQAKCKPQPFWNHICDIIREHDPSFEGEKHVAINFFWPYCCYEKFRVLKAFKYLQNYQSEHELPEKHKNHGKPPKEPCLHPNINKWPQEHKTKIIPIILRKLHVVFEKKRPTRAKKDKEPKPTKAKRKKRRSTSNLNEENQEENLPSKSPSKKKRKKPKSDILELE